MNKTEWKPLEEIRFSLKPYDRLAVIGCTVCAMFSGTGGAEGIKTFRQICFDLDKEVVFSHCITPCCSEEIMGRALKLYRKKIHKADALVVLSCASGIKSAFIANPETDIVSVLDPVGSVVVGSGQSDSELLESICRICGKCVISYTAGICPVYKCPAKAKYQPCAKAPETTGPCGVNPAQVCVWGEIRKYGAPRALETLGRLHKKEDLTPVAPAEVRHTGKSVRYPVSIFLSVFKFCEKCVRWIQ